jgi:hypothetical protein
MNLDARYLRNILGAEDLSLEWLQSSQLYSGYNSTQLNGTHSRMRTRTRTRICSH